MRKLTIIFSIFFIAACAAQSTSTRRELAVPIKQEIASPTATILLETETSTATLVPPAATPTETPLPPLELPTPLANPPALLAWDGAPTYPGDSKPDYLFRVRYDPEIWALTTDSYGYPAIGHRGIEYCVIAPAFGRGLPSNTTVEHDQRKFGSIEFEINTVFRGGARQSVFYLGGDANVYTGFEVSFIDNADLCLQEAELVIATFASVKVTQATPVP